MSTTRTRRSSAVDLSPNYDAAKVPKNAYLEDPKKGLGLLTQIVSTQSDQNEASELLKELENLLHHDFVELCRRADMPGEAALFKMLIDLFEDLSDVVEFPHLANRNVVAIAGGFSSGKSTFLNSLLGEEVLPTDTAPTTSIPTYIVKDEEEFFDALNTFNRIIGIDKEAVKAISHAFHAAYQTSFYHILKILMVGAPKLAFGNLALLDTPGYSKADTQNAGNTDADKAKEHLRTSDHLIWVLDLSQGTLPESDVQFLRDLEWEEPIFFVLNRADKRPPAEQQQIFAQVKLDIEKYGFKCAGICAYNSLDGGQTMLGDDPKKYLADIDGKFKYTQWKKRFEALFNRFVRHNLKEEERNKNVLHALNTLQLKGNELLNAEDKEKLRLHTKEMSEDTKKHALAKKNFEVFSEKVEKQVTDILNLIGVKDENLEVLKQIFVTGTWQARSKEVSFGKYDQGQSFTGVVNSNSIMGVFVKVAELDDLVHIEPKAIQRHFKDMSFFGKGSELHLIIEDIQFEARKITFKITPKN